MKHTFFHAVVGAAGDKGASGGHTDLHVNLPQVLDCVDV